MPFFQQNIKKTTNDIFKCLLPADGRSASQIQAEARPPGSQGQ
jgi:hypothetical protein